MFLWLDFGCIAPFQNLQLLLGGNYAAHHWAHHWDTNDNQRAMKGTQNKRRVRRRHHGCLKSSIYKWTRLIFLLSCATLSNGVYPTSPSLKGTSLSGGTPSDESDDIPSKPESNHQQYQTQQPPQIHHNQEPTPPIDVGPTVPSSSSSESNSPTQIIQAVKIKSSPSLPTSNSQQRNNSVRRTKPRRTQNSNSQDSELHNNHRSQSNQHHHTFSSNESNHDIFLRWCHTVLGITGPVTIQDFEYEDHLHQWIQDHHIHYEDEQNNEDDDFYDLSTHIRTTVRGLAATRPISVGEVVISVPYNALLSIETTIDHDPVLAQIMGPEARKKYNWSLESSSGINKNENNTKKNSDGGAGADEEENSFNDLMGTNGNGDATPSMYEISLMIVALLYHLDLGPDLSPIWHYVESLLDADCDETMPFLYDSHRLKQVFGDTPKIRTLARDIRRDVNVMYESVMSVLIQDHGDIFAPPSKNKEKEGELDEAEDEWMYSFDKFMWAFAMVNSRHWHLPVPEFDHTLNSDANKTTVQHLDSANAVPNAPPAQQPTEEFISLQDEAIKMEHIEEYTDETLKVNLSPLQDERAGMNQVRRHSFMVPLADMMNFGPPCTRGSYNSETKAFEVIATCSFRENQEITFWYSDDCEDDIIANYGFVHPIIPSCSTLEDWKYRSDKWKEYAQSLEQSLDEAYEDHYVTLQELQSCDCKGNSGESSAKEGSEGEKRRREPKYRKTNNRSKQLDL